MMEIVTAAMRKREGGVLLPDAGELTGEVRQLVRDRVHDLAFALDARRTGKSRTDALWAHKASSPVSSRPRRGVSCIRYLR